jgi:hypothetical protein
MKIRRWLLPGLLLPVLLGARTPALLDVEGRVRAGNAAFARGAFAEAAGLYEQAADRATEPTLVAFNLATAKYHLARELERGDPQRSAALADAEQAYRCCLEKGTPLRARALFGLGNCLLLRAAGTSPDRVALRSAIDRFGECTRDPGCKPALAADARYNRQRARLLLLQSSPSSESAAQEPSGEDPEDNPPEPPKSPEDKRGDGLGEKSENKGTPASPTKAGTEEAKGEQKGSQAAGKGTLVPVSDNSDATPLPPGDALEHLEQATRRILDDVRQHRRGRSRPARSGVRDW